ncbi:MAG: ASCH domain-containing protein [Candidatus Paceibacterota bacterium]
MKPIKFNSDLVDKILTGEKTTTWRLFDDKDLKLGDELEFINKETLETFGYGKIISLKIKTLGTLNEEDWVGHARYDSDEDMYSDFKKFYGDKVNKDTEVKIINFEFRL